MNKYSPFTVSLVCGIVLLFIGSCFLPTTAHNTKNIPLQTFDGKWLYVGGNGPGNYTKIQDAIDDASTGDTVFVYNGTYYEHVIVDKSITLLGENKTTTTIDGQEQNSHLITLLAGNVTVSSFTLQNCGDSSNAAELYIHSDNNQIIDNIMTCTPYHGEEGIWLWNSSSNIIIKNTIQNHHFGIWLEYSSRNTLVQNMITNIGEWGIILGNAERNTISENTLTENEGGIYLRDSSSNILIQNNIVHNLRGVALVESVSSSTNNTIIKNNFMRNKYIDATFVLAKTSHSKNLWDANYWNRPLLFPRLIFGSKAFLLLPGIPFHFPSMTLLLPWVTLDKHPALESYSLVL